MRGTRRTPMKIFLYALVLTGALAVAGVVVFVLSLTTLIQKGVETMGPRVLGVPVTLDDVDLSLLPGGTAIQVSLKQLTIGNPEGYETASAVSLPHVRVRVDWKSLLSDTVVIEDVLIEGPRITFERFKLGSNLRDIQHNVTRHVQSDSDDAEDEEREAGHEEDEESDSRVHIKTVRLQDAEMNVSLLGGQRGVMQLPLPDLVLHDIGKASGGASLREASAQIFSAMYTAIINTVTKAGTLLPKGVEQLGQSAADLGKKVEKAGKALLKGLFKQ